MIHVSKSRVGSLVVIGMAHGSNALHATFGRAQSISLCRKWASGMHLSVDEMQKDISRASTLIRARLALEYPSSFMIVSLEDDKRPTGFVCTPIGPDVHRVDAVMWPSDIAENRAYQTRFESLRAWHAKSYPDVCLVAGSLTTDEIAAWD